MLRFITAALVLSVSQASAETVINYHDGSTYTLEGEQEIYISTPASSLFKRQVLSNKDTFFRVQVPWSARDYVATPTDGLQPGSVEWCKDFVPWANGLTFDQVTFNRYCDTNNAGVFDELDDLWA